MARLPARGGPGLLYGLRVHGPYDPGAGARCNPNKLLLDPYARAIGRDLTYDDALYGYTIGGADADLRSTSATAPRTRRWAR